jgi:hypothetical protein
VGSIQNDDAVPSLIVDDLTVTEGINSGTTAAVFTVSLSNLSDQAVTVNWTTADSTATVANNGYRGSVGHPDDSGQDRVRNHHRARQRRPRRTGRLFLDDSALPSARPSPMRRAWASSRQAPRRPQAISQQSR